MDAKTYRETIAKLGLSQVSAAAFLQQGERTGRRYAALGLPQGASGSSILLRLMLALKLGPQQVYTLLDMDPASFIDAPLKAGRPAKKEPTDG